MSHLRITLLGPGRKVVVAAADSLYHSWVVIAIITHNNQPCSCLQARVWIASYTRGHCCSWVIYYSQRILEKVRRSHSVAASAAHMTFYSWAAPFELIGFKNPDTHTRCWANHLARRYCFLAKQSLLRYNPGSCLVAGRQA
jgi:hypothetical protein